MISISIMPSLFGVYDKYTDAAVFAKKSAKVYPGLYSIHFHTECLLYFANRLKLPQLWKPSWCLPDKARLWQGAVHVWSVTVDTVKVGWQDRGATAGEGFSSQIDMDHRGAGYCFTAEPFWMCKKKVESYTLSLLVLTWCKMFKLLCMHMSFNGFRNCSGFAGLIFFFNKNYEWLSLILS